MEKIIQDSGNTLLPKINLITIFNIVLSIILFFILVIMNLVELKASSPLGNAFYGLSNIFLLWTMFEIGTKKNYNYILFLFFLSVPLQNWLVFTSNTWGFIFYPFVINFTFIVALILMIRIFTTFKKDIKIEFISFILFFVILMISIISLINSKDIYLTTNSIIYALLVPFIIYTLIISIVKNSTDMIIIYENIVISLFLINILNFILDRTILSDNMNRLSGGIFENPNYYAPLLLISALLSLFLLFYFKNTENHFRIIYLITFVFSLYLLLSAGSRTSFVALIIGLVMFYFQLARTSKKIIISLILVSGFFLIISYIDIEMIMRNSSFSTLKRFFVNSEGEGLGPRALIWSDSINYILENKLFLTGIGFGLYLFDEIGWNGAHNSFLYLAMQIGVLGALLYHLLIIYHINIRSLFSQSLVKNISGILLVVLLIQWTITGNGYQWYPVDVTRPNVTVHLDVIYIWLLLGMSFATRSFENKKL